MMMMTMEGMMDKAVLDDIIRRLLDGKGGKQVQLSEAEIRQLCVNARNVFLSQPNLLQLHAPIRIAGPLSPDNSFEFLRLCYPIPMFSFAALVSFNFLGVCLIAGAIGGKSAIAIGNSLILILETFGSFRESFWMPGNFGGERIQLPLFLVCLVFLFVGGRLFGETRREFLSFFFFFCHPLPLDLVGNGRMGRFAKMLIFFFSPGNCKKDKRKGLKLAVLWIRFA